MARGKVCARILQPLLRRLSTAQGKQRKGKARDAAPQGAADDSWQRTDVVEKATMQNERLVKYYRAQNILPDDEWEAFMNSMRELLPTTFRVAGSRQSVVMLYAAALVH